MDSQNYRILLVEDNPADADLVRAQLSAGGASDRYHVEHAELLSAAVSRIERESFDVVLLDLNLPDSFGPTTFDKLHRHAHDIPVIVMTGVDDEEIGANLVKLGAQDYLVKWQLTQSVLARCIRYAIERASVERDLREARSHAIDASRAKSDFLAGMSHEIRTPMNSILGMSDLLLETKLSADQDKYVRILQRAGNALLDLINGILDLSKIEAGKFELDHSEFDLVELIESTRDVVAYPAEQKGIGLSIDIAQDVARRVVGDPGRVRQVLVNLIGNAIKFTETGAVRVEVSSEPGSQGRVRFVVVDTGVGIPADRLEAVFESFTQSDPSIAQKYGGTGLGLSLSLSLARKMGGTIDAKSELGEGSTFVFTVPFEEAEDIPPTTIANSPKSLAPEQSSRTLRILLVDDSSDNRMLARTFLKDSPHQVDEADGGHAAVEMFKEGEYDLVLMDIHMPDLSGYEATRQIRLFEQEEGASSTPIIALTAFAFEEEKLKSLEAGCDAHLSKPINKKRLLDAISANTDAGKEIVHIDPEIRDIVGGFLENRKRDVGALQEAVDKQDHETIQRLGHNMKGSGGGYGFHRISEIGAALDQAGKHRNLDAARVAVVDLAQYVERVHVVFE